MKPHAFRYYKRRYGTENKKAVILLSGWKGTQTQYWIFSKLLERNGYHCITYTYDNQILSTDPKEMVTNILLVVDDIIHEVELLKSQKIPTVTLFGTSLGSTLAILSAEKTPNVDAVVLNTSGEDISKIIWSWETVMKGFKRELIQKGYTFKKLNDELESINRKEDIKKLKNKKIMLLLSTKDKIIPHEYSLNLAYSLKKVNSSTIVKTSHTHAHFMYGVINLLKASTCVKILE